MMKEKDNEDKKFKIYLRGDVFDAWTLTKEEYDKKTRERWKNGENIMVEIVDIEEEKKGIEETRRILAKIMKI